MLSIAMASLAFPLLGFFKDGFTNEARTTGSQKPDTDDSTDKHKKETEPTLKIQYLEIVSPDADALCKQYSKVHGITFSEPKANFGNARTAKLSDGGLIGIRAPLRSSETPVVRPYTLVKDIEASVAAAADAGAKIAMPPMKISGHGSFAIVIHGGIECGLWQN